MRFKIVFRIGYEGGPFSGWQAQATTSGDPTLCDAFNRRRGCRNQFCNRPHRCRICNEVSHGAVICPLKKNATESVQECVDAWVKSGVIEVFSTTPGGVVGCSRTDKGVSAYSCYCFCNVQNICSKVFEKKRDEFVAVLLKTSPTGIWLWEDPHFPCIVPAKTSIGTDGQYFSGGKANFLMG